MRIAILALGALALAGCTTAGAKPEILSRTDRSISMQWVERGSAGGRAQQRQEMDAVARDYCRQRGMGVTLGDEKRLMLASQPGWTAPAPAWLLRYDCVAAS